MNRIILFIVFFFLISVVVTPKAEIVDRIVAIVNDEIVSLYEMEQVLKPYAERIKGRGFSPEKEEEAIYKLREDILNSLIDQKLTDQEIRRTGVSVSEDEIDNAVERFKESRMLTDEELREGLEKQGISFDDYRNRIKDQILRSKLISFEVKSGIVITDEDIKSYYDSSNEFKGKTAYHLSAIILKVPHDASTSEEQAIQAKMESILERLKAGADFKEMAKQHSDFFSEEGGELRVFTLDELLPQIRDAVEKINPGEFTQVLKIDPGYQIFYLKDIIKTGGKTLEEAKPEIEEKLYAEIAEKRFQTWLETLRTRSHIKIIR